MATEILIYAVGALFAIAAAFALWCGILWGYAAWKESELRDDIRRKRRTDE